MNINNSSLNNKKSDSDIIEISLSGLVPIKIDYSKIYRCAMCNQVLDLKKESLIDHSMLCTGF
ncbi:hypothetical protein [Acinetobacter baumannii]|uniref:hypothetical protein n=1 Tax=Acinetobacter baumannii TaxID=470 RepID=UPI00233FF8C6|nr:hypothetical protein [Acinetobacter baumannii]MDC4147570.1 hypothetical protein [Acinetobacter baumannii]